LGYYLRFGDATKSPLKKAKKEHSFPSKASPVRSTTHGEEDAHAEEGMPTMNEEDEQDIVDSSDKKDPDE